MKKYAGVLLCFVPLLSYGVSFDCKKANGFVETTICQNKELGAYDDLLTSNYKEVQASDIGDAARSNLKKTQIAWIKSRNQCADVSCLQTSYKKRIDEICDYPVLSGVFPDCKTADTLNIANHAPEKSVTLASSAASRPATTVATQSAMDIKGIRLGIPPEQINSLSANFFKNPSVEPKADGKTVAVYACGVPYGDPKTKPCNFTIGEQPSAFATAYFYNNKLSGLDIYFKAYGNKSVSPEEVVGKAGVYDLANGLKASLNAKYGQSNMEGPAFDQRLKKTEIHLNRNGMGNRDPVQYTVNSVYGYGKPPLGLWRGSKDNSFIALIPFAIPGVGPVYILRLTSEESIDFDQEWRYQMNLKEKEEKDKARLNNINRQAKDL